MTTQNFTTKKITAGIHLVLERPQIAIWIMRTMNPALAEEK